MIGWLVLFAGCGNGKNMDSGGLGGCGEVIGSADTISTPILDPLVALYEGSGGTWEGILPCEWGAPTSTLSFTFSPGPTSEIVVTSEALADDRPCPAASVYDLPISVQSDRWDYEGPSEVALAVEGASDEFSIYVAAEGKLSIRFYLDGTTIADMGPDNCIGPVTRQATTPTP